LGVGKAPMEIAQLHEVEVRIGGARPEPGQARSEDDAAKSGDFHEVATARQQADGFVRFDWVRHGEESFWGDRRPKRPEGPVAYSADSTAGIKSRVPRSWCFRGVTSARSWFERAASRSG